MDVIENIELEDISFGKEIAKEFTISLAATAGVLVGFIAVGLVVTRVKRFKAARNAKKTNTEN